MHEGDPEQFKAREHRAVAEARTELAEAKAGAEELHD